MSDQTNIHDDISYMRKLAETGRRGQILGGVFLAAAGIVFGVTCIIDWFGQIGYLSIRGWSELWLWLGAFAVFTLFWVYMMLRFRAQQKPTASASNAMFGMIWSACGAGVMVSFGTTVLIANRMHELVVLSAYVPVIFAFYGTAWFASGYTAKRPWMYFAGLGSFVFSVVIALLTASNMQTPAMGLGLLLLLTAPGFKLMSDEARS